MRKLGYAALIAGLFVANIGIIVAFASPAHELLEHCRITGSRCLGGALYAIAFVASQLAGVAAVLYIGFLEQKVAGLERAHPRPGAEPF